MSDELRQHVGITPQMANVVVMEIFLRAMEKVEFRTPRVSEADNREMEKAKSRFLERMRENLNYARKQLG
jgi:hypothetical protein